MELLSEQTETLNREAKRKKRERVLIIALLFIILGLTYLEIHLFHLEGISVSNEVMVFVLIDLNFILLLLMIFLVLRNLVKLFLERRKKILGHRLRSKLVIIFVGFSIVPSIILFFFSIRFISTSFDYWFSYQVENSLLKSLNIVQMFYDQTKDLNSHKIHQIVQKISDDYSINKESSNIEDLLKSQQKTLNIDMLLLLDQDATTIAKFIGDIPDPVPVALPGKEVFKKPMEHGVSHFITRFNNGEMVMTIYKFTEFYWTPPDDKDYFLVAGTYFNPEMISSMDQIQEGYKGYQQVKFFKQNIKWILYFTLSLVTLLIIFSAIWLGFYLAKTLTQSIQSLAIGTEKVGSGELEFQIPVASDDEMGILINGFNKMTSDLRSTQEAYTEANLKLEKQNFELDNRRNYIETILQNISAGVITINKDGIINTINKSVKLLFGMHEQDVIGHHYKTILNSEQMQIIDDIRNTVSLYKNYNIERQLRTVIGNRSISIMIHAAPLSDDIGEHVGMLIVIDDLTQLEKAQRMAAWREVARRIAHEIKNPLTPIQLSAQRLRKRYENKLKDDYAVFDECTNMIINQVAELKTLVNEFSQFARLPSTQPVPCNLLELLAEIISMYSSTEEKDIHFILKAINDIPKINLDREQFKRVLINLMDNALIATEEVGGGDIIISIDFDPILKFIRLEVADNGIGIPPENKSRLFEPYYTTKKSGTGLGLAIASTIIADHNGFIRVADNHPKGAKFIIEIPIET